MLLSIALAIAIALAIDPCYNIYVLLLTFVPLTSKTLLQLVPLFCSRVVLLASKF